jgi:sec-independent protein translocase protein TatC
VIAAIVTPSADVVTQSALAGPMIGLYILGVLIAWVFGRKRDDAPDDDVEDSVSGEDGS